MSDLSDNFETLQDMKKENKKLQSKVDDLTIDNTRLRQDQYELERLRELYKLDETGSATLRSTKGAKTESRKTVMFLQAAALWEL